LVANHSGKRNIINLPLSVAILLSKVGDFIQKIIRKDLPFNSRQLTKMTSSLTFDDTRARSIGWKPRSVIENPNLWLE